MPPLSYNPTTKEKGYQASYGVIVYEYIPYFKLVGLVLVILVIFSLNMQELSSS